MEQQRRSSTSAGSADDGLMSKIARNKVFTVVIIALVVIAALWIIKDLQIRRLRAQSSADIQSTRNEAANKIMQSEQEKLRLLAKPYVWAVRTEMLRGNLNQVDLYAADMIQQPNFQLIMIADAAGRIVSSTDQKIQGTAYTDTAMLSSDTTIVQLRADSTLFLSSPIMGFNSRLGTLLVTYSPGKPEFQRLNNDDVEE